MKWNEVENCKWISEIDNNKYIQVKALFNLDSIFIIESLYINDTKYNSGTVFSTESNYDANEFMLNNYGIEVEFGY